MPKYILLVLWILLYLGLSYGIGMMTQTAIPGWYETLTPPPLNPPNFIFPIMWSILYMMIAAAGWYIWTRRKTIVGADRMFMIYAVYMLFNWGWSFVFFAMQMLLGGLLWIAALNILSIWFVALALKHAKPAAYLMVPPTLWTLFAMYLNGGYWWLN